MDNITEKEEIFHDDWANAINVDDVLVDEFFEACTAPENRIILRKLQEFNNKKILELGCGAGEASVYFAKKGADVVASDISGGMLNLAQKLASNHNVKIETKKFSTTNIDFPDNTFDIVYAANLLHHVDIKPTIAEVNRVLKKNGIFVSYDPVQYNPIINIYRKMANEVRTSNEHPILRQDVRLMKKTFSKVECYFTWFTTLLIFIKFYLIDRIHPNQERYWKKIIIEHKKLEPLYNKLDTIDKILIRLFPFLKWYCWNIVIIAVK